VAALHGDAAGGKKVFTTYCATCHRIGREGNDIGPELTNIGKKFDRTALLDAIINPSAAILLGYEPWLVNTSDGASYFGFIVSENKRSITIKDVAGQQHNIAADKITTRKKQEKSLMPEPSVTGLSAQQLADVAAYLQQGGK
jgi:putative heme-binding domain-containing protein